MHSAKKKSRNSVSCIGNQINRKTTEISNLHYSCGHMLPNVRCFELGVRTVYLDWPRRVLPLRLAGKLPTWPHKETESVKSKGADCSSGIENRNLAPSSQFCNFLCFPLEETRALILGLLLLSVFVKPVGISFLRFLALKFKLANGCLLLEGREKGEKRKMERQTNQLHKTYFNRKPS